jgi:hypothetical protein
VEQPYPNKFIHTQHYASHVRFPVDTAHIPAGAAQALQLDDQAALQEARPDLNVAVGTGRAETIAGRSDAENPLKKIVRGDHEE